MMTRARRPRRAIRRVPRRSGVRRMPSGGPRGATLAGRLAGTVAVAPLAIALLAVALLAVALLAVGVRPGAERRLESRHEIGDRRMLDTGRRRDLATLGLARDQRANALLHLVLVFRRIERRMAQMVDHAARE